MKNAHFDCLWDETDDASLLRGVYEYGMGSWEAIKMDPEFNLHDKVGFQFSLCEYCKWYYPAVLCINYHSIFWQYDKVTNFQHLKNETLNIFKKKTFNISFLGFFDITDKVAYKMGFQADFKAIMLWRKEPSENGENVFGIKFQELWFFIIFFFRYCQKAT